MTTTTAPSSSAREPRVVGGRYRSHYWGTDYTVLAIRLTERGDLESITVRDDDGTRSHCTGWDSRDQILFDPRSPGPLR